MALPRSPSRRCRCGVTPAHLPSTVTDVVRCTLEQGTAEISHFCVARAEQRGGIGSALLKEVRRPLPRVAASMLIVT